MKAHYTSQAGVEALSHEADTSFSGAGTHHANSNPAYASMTTGTGTATATQEADVTIA